MGRTEWIPGRRVCETDLPEAATPADRSQAITVNILKLICLTIIQLAKQAWLFPQSVVHAVQQRRQKLVLKELEVERLDRICNPSKFRGK